MTKTLADLQRTEGYYEQITVLDETLSLINAAATPLAIRQVIQQIPDSYLAALRTTLQRSFSAAIKAAQASITADGYEAPASAAVVAADAETGE